MKHEAQLPLWSLRLVSFFVLAACAGDDRSAEQAADAGVDLDLGLPDVAATPLCDLQRPEELVSGPCTTSSECGSAGICVGDGAGGANCAALCFPEACADGCGVGRTCAGLALSDGSDFRFDANGDGQTELWGACFAESVEVAPTWGECGTAADCAADSLCARIPGRPTGTCFPRCEGPCALYNGFVPECVGTSGGGASICVVLCDPANGGSACPEGLLCTIFGEGVAACSR
jgi:hypothetical protein